jgi:hypothetical protein
MAVGIHCADNPLPAKVGTTPPAAAVAQSFEFPDSLQQSPTWNDDARLAGKENVHLLKNPTVEQWCLLECYAVWLF